MAILVTVSLNSLNVNMLTWKELSPTTSHGHGPMMKSRCGMVSVQINGEDYLAVFGGSGSSSNNTPHQPDAQYSGLRTNEIHYFHLLTGKQLQIIMFSYYQTHITFNCQSIVIIKL